MHALHRGEVLRPMMSDIGRQKSSLDARGTLLALRVVTEAACTPTWPTIGCASGGRLDRQVTLTHSLTHIHTQELRLLDVEPVGYV
jgi:hypothetical protein